MSYGRTISLHDVYGNRKYLTQEERVRFEREAFLSDPYTKIFCRLLLWTGARVSEIMSLKASDIDISNQVVILRTLKQRRTNVFRQIPVELSLIQDLSEVFALDGMEDNRANKTLWPWSKRSGQRRIKEIMEKSHIGEVRACAKGLRHSFAVHCVLSEVPLTIIKKWMGHAYLETTAIYLNVVGPEERSLAKRIWRKQT